jgi:hypothetical protein
MHYFNVLSKKTIPLSEGQKTIFHKIGVIKVTENGGWYLQLYQQPNTDFHIVPSGENELPVIE